MNWWDQFVTNLGTQNSPFGFAPQGVAPSQEINQPMQAGYNMLGNIGAGMLANSSQNPMAAFGNAYRNASDQARNENREAAAAAAMMQQADEKKKERAQAEQRQAEIERAISQLPPDQQSLARMMPERFFGQQIDQQFATPDLTANQKDFNYAQQNPAYREFLDRGKANNVPNGYRVTQNGNLEYIPGGPADPHVRASQGAGGVTTKMRNDAVAVDQAYNNLTSALDNYKGLIQKTGGVALPGIDADAVQRSRTNIQLQLKELYNLGVLNGPDLSLMQEMIFDPQVSAWNPVDAASKGFSMATGGLSKRAEIAIDDLKSMLKTIRDNKTKGILDAPASSDAPPEGIAPDIWDMMTDEEKQLWRQN